MQQYFKILGSGHYLPATIVSAAEIDRRACLAEGWTELNTGVLHRRECLAPETLASMAREAILLAVENSGVAWKDIDLIIDCSTCRHQPIPCNAALIQRELGNVAAGIACFDVQSTCLGFLVALNIANGLLASNAYRNIIITCSEAGLAGVNFRQPESAGLMGDGAAAVVVGRGEASFEMHFLHETYSEHGDTCYVRGGNHNLPPFLYTPDREAEFRFHMDGPALFRIALRLLPPMARRLIEFSSCGRDQLFVVPHQGSPRAVEAVRRLLKFSEDQYENRVTELGNLLAASIPTVLDLCRREGKIEAGDIVLLLGTSAGYSQAGLVFQL